MQDKVEITRIKPPFWQGEVTGLAAYWTLIALLTIVAGLDTLKYVYLGWPITLPLMALAMLFGVLFYRYFYWRLYWVFLAVFIIEIIMYGIIIRLFVY